MRVRKPQVGDAFFEVSLQALHRRRIPVFELRDEVAPALQGGGIGRRAEDLLDDAWPGQFTDFVLRLGGKTGLARYPGHDFFHVVMRAKKGKDDRGKMRQLAAQIAMLLLTRRQTGAFRDINAAALDDFYYENLGFDAESDDANRVIKVLDKITALLRDQKRSKILGHEAIHLVLLVDTLLDDYTRAWEAKFADAFDAFRENLARAKATRYDDVPNEYWLRYGEGTRSNTDRADVIQRRHEFFASKMREALQPVLKDPQRIFGTLDRDLIYYRDRKQCAVCNTDVVWQEAEFHHVEQHSQGGRTVVDNGALVHKECHPKGAAKEAKFADTWRKRQAAAAAAPAPTLADVVKEEKGLDKLAKIFMKAAPGTTFEEARQTIKEHLKNLRTRSADDDEDEDDEENGEVA